MIETPHFVLFLKSMETQIFPLQSHQCALPDGERIVIQDQDATARVGWMCPIGNYLTWSCPHCDLLHLISCDTLYQNSKRCDALLADDNLLYDSPFFMSVNEWLRRSPVGLTRDQLQALIDREK